MPRLVFLVAALALAGGCAHVSSTAAAGSALATGDHTVAIDGRTVAYHVGGRGPTCIVHPGGPGLTWSYLRMPELEKRLTLVYLEPVGSGGSSPLPAGELYTMQRYGDELERFRAALGLSRVCIIGHSHGGFVAQRYAIDHADRVSALVVYGASSRGDQEFFGAFMKSIERFSTKPWYREASTALLNDDPKTDAEATASYYRQLPVYFADYDSQRARYDAAAKVPWSAAPLLGMMAPGQKPTDFRAEYGKVTAPTLVVVGRSDVSAPEKFAREIADGIKGARLELFEHSGHMIHLEEPARFAEVVGDFVRAQR